MTTEDPIRSVEAARAYLDGPVYQALWNAGFDIQKDGTYHYKVLPYPESEYRDDITLYIDDIARHGTCNALKIRSPHYAQRDRIYRFDERRKLNIDGIVAAVTTLAQQARARRVAWLREEAEEKARQTMRRENLEVFYLTCPALGVNQGDVRENMSGTPYVRSPVLHGDIEPSELKPGRVRLSTEKLDLHCLPEQLIQLYQLLREIQTMEASS